MNKSIKVLWFIAIILFIFLLCIDFDNQSFVFFNSTNSFASDFFNVCRYPYTLVFDYHNQTFATCAQNMVCVLSFLSFTFFCSVLWIISSIKILRKYKVRFYEITFKPRQGGVNSINMKRIFKIGWKALRDFKQINANLRKK